MRLSLTKLTSACVIIVIIFLTWTFLNAKPQFTHTCNKSAEYIDNLHHLTARAHDVLSSLGLTHFLCYGTLWGQIRNSQVLPWARRSQMCVLNMELSRLDEASVYRAFIKTGLHISYTSSEGMYIISNPSYVGPAVELFVFEEMIETKAVMLHRVGWKRRLLPRYCDWEYLECFPGYLLAPPLPLKELGGVSLPVPRGGVEIQKFHYSKNWWKEIAEKNCNL